MKGKKNILKDKVTIRARLRHDTYVGTMVRALMEKATIQEIRWVISAHGWKL